MGFLRPKVYTPPAPQLPAPPEKAGAEDTQRAAALSEEAVKMARKRKGAGSTQVAGALGPSAGTTTTGTPTLLG